MLEMGSLQKQVHRIWEDCEVWDPYDGVLGCRVVLFVKPDTNIPDNPPAFIFRSEEEVYYKANIPENSILTWFTFHLSNQFAYLLS